MKPPLLFYFDFSSPYGWLAAQQIEALAAKHDRGVSWKPMLLGAVFKQTGTAPLTMIPLKGDYSRRDIARSARFHGLPEFTLPDPFPIATQAPARLVVWQRTENPERAAVLVKALYRAYFAEHQDISKADIVIAVAARESIDADAARAAIESSAIKDALRRDVDEAIARGVFGSPFVFVDGEAFWGLDRFEQIDRWLATGGF
jgi:2-hydroxychromene-2-carboxylate isomerase